MHACRRVLALLLALPLLALLAGAAEAQVLSTRIWPAKDYTRLTIESKQEIPYSLFMLKDPERVVLELEVDDLPQPLAELHSKVAEFDPHIQGLRVARNRPGVVRVVLDLKGEAKPQAFTLKPIEHVKAPRREIAHREMRHVQIAHRPPGRVRRRAIHADAEERHLIAEAPSLTRIEIAGVIPPLDLVVGMTDMIRRQRHRTIGRGDLPLGLLGILGLPGLLGLSVQT